MSTVLWILMVSTMGVNSSFVPLADFKTEADCAENRKVINEVRGNNAYASCVPISNKANFLWRP